MKYIFGKSQAARILESLVADDAYLQAKVSRHVSDYFHYVDEISKLKNRRIKVRALEFNLECDLDVSEEIKKFIMNVKIAKRRQALENI